MSKPSRKRRVSLSGMIEAWDFERARYREKAAHRRRRRKKLEEKRWEQDFRSALGAGSYL